MQSECLTRFQIDYSEYDATNVYLSADNNAFGIDKSTQCLFIENISSLKSLKTGFSSLNVSLISSTGSSSMLFDSVLCNIYVTSKCEQEFYAIASDNVFMENSEYILRFEIILNE